MLYNLKNWNHLIHPYFESEYHHNDIIMTVMSSQITGASNVYSPFCSGANQRKHQISESLLCEGNPQVTSRFPSQSSSNAENVSNWWRHHVWFQWGVWTSNNRIWQWFRLGFVLTNMVKPAISIPLEIVISNHKDLGTLLLAQIGRTWMEFLHPQEIWDVIIHP